MPAYMASNTKPLIYLNVPKSACTSIKNWLYTLDTGEVLEDPHSIHDMDTKVFVHSDGSRAELVKRFYDSFVFTFVRHPLRRAYSCFNEKIFDTGGRSFPVARKFIETNYGVDFTAPRTIARHRADFLVFLRFAHDTATRKVPFDNDWHWAQQTVVINNAHKMRPLDFIGRVESVDEDFAFVTKKGRCVGEMLPRLNEGPSAIFRYEDIVDDEVAELGRFVYAEDLRNFAYAIETVRDQKPVTGGAAEAAAPTAGPSP